MNDPYKILGVPGDASTAVIKKAYRSLAREHHPDLDTDNPHAEDNFKAISMAYEILSHPQTRRQFDGGEIDGLGAKVAGGSRRSGTTTRKQGAAGDKAGGSSGPRPALKINGADVEYSLTLSFLDAARGGVKYISTTNGKRLKVTVPAGIDNAGTLRLKGQGMPGFGEGRAGDALVEITVEADPLFSRAASDILMDLPVTLPEAVLGAKVEVATIDGPVTVTIPPASNTGSVLRLKNKGLPTTDKAGEKPDRGDQYITLKVVLPKKQDPEFTEFVRAWSENNRYEINRKRTSAASPSQTD